jgi:hypothetical protein
MGKNIKTVVKSNSAMEISWTAPSDATSDTWYQVTLVSPNDTKVFQTKTPYLSATNLLPESYKVGITSCNGGVCSGTNVLSVASINLPGKVSQPKVKKITAKSAVVSWKKPSARGGKAVKKYVVTIQRKADDGWKTVRSTGVTGKTTLTVKKLASHKKYRVTVSALSGHAVNYEKALRGASSNIKSFKTK